MTSVCLRTRFTRFVRAFLTTLVLAAGLATAASTSAVAAPGGFDDVPDGQWYSDAIAWMADTGITTGTSPTTFSPDEPVSRAQLAAFFERYLQTEGDPGAHGFSDVPAGSYYDGAVSLLVDREITTGTSPTTYSPQDTVTRAQMAAFLWRLAGEPTVEAANPFDDVGDGTWYTEPVRWLVDKGITTGTSATTYSPLDDVTRAQMATFLWRLAGEPAVGEDGLNRIDETMTIVSDGSEVDFTSLDVEGESELEWTGDDTPEVGQILNITEGEGDADGFLGRVTAVDGSTVTTEPAAVTDVVENGEFEVDRGLEENAEALEEVQLSLTAAIEEAEFECSGGAEFNLDPGLSVTPNMSLSSEWKRFKLQSFTAEFGVNLRAEVTATATGEVACSATVTSTTKQFKDVKVWVGPVRVKITPKLTFSGTLSANFSAAGEASWVYDEDLGVELTYSDGEWDMDEDPAGDTSPTLTYELGGEAVFRLDLQARLDLLLFNRAGPFLKVGPFFEFVAQTDDPWWYVDAGITATVGGSVKLWGWEAEVASGPFELARWRLAEAPPGLQPGPGYESPSKLQSFDVSIGQTHLCVITARHEVACQGWNDNAAGWLGTGDTDLQVDLTPIAPPIVDGEPLAAVQVEAGDSITCARYEDGSVRCWGANWHGAASPTPGDVLSPNLIDLPAPAIEIFQPWTRQACALLETFELACWGRVYESDYLDLEQFPEVWARDTSDFNPPYVVEGLTQVVDADVSGHHVCALLSDGTLECLGDFSAGGIPGSVWNEGEVLDRVVMTPQPMEGVTDVVEVDDGCGVRRDGTVTCWANKHDDDPFAGVDDAVAVAIGNTRCVLHATGAVSCVASGSSGGFGAPGADDDAVLSPIAGWGSADPDADVIRTFDLTAGNVGMACAQTGGNRTFCWGNTTDPEMLDAIVR